MRSRRVSVLAWAAVAVTGLVGNGRAQITLPPGPEIFSAPQALTFASVRTMGMGNISSVVVDPYSRNPAHAAWLEEPQANVVYANYSFNGGLDADYTMFRYEFPVKWTKHKDGLQLVYFNLDSNRGGVSITGAPPGVPTQIQMEDQGVYLGYGFFITEKTALGISTALRNSRTRVYAPISFPVGPMTEVAEADSDSVITPKFRVAVQHELDDQWDFGAVLTASDQRATITLPGFVAADATDHFDQVDYDVGFAYHPNDKVTLAGEWFKRKLTSDSFAYRDEGLNFGAEVKAGDQWELRAGSHEGNPTLGFSYTNNDWKVEYAFVKDFEQDDLAPLFGDADLHTISLTKSW
ncbi:MAG: hypothetical protein GW893_02310 [Armatimonadetes bacterium]|nr:hypothetical protein [Armatimonadota bacterium]